MNPDTNKFEELTVFDKQRANDLCKCGSGKKFKACCRQVTVPVSQLLRPNGTPVPGHWSIFHIDEVYEINGYTFKCKYIGETSILFEPFGPIVLDSGE